MAFGIGGPRGGLAAGGAAEAECLPGPSLVRGPVEEIVVVEPVECVLEHGLVPLAESVSVSLSAMPLPSSPRRAGHIGKVPYLRRGAGP